MISITIDDLGTFSADTEKEVQKLVRKAKKDKAALEYTKETERSEAGRRAEQNGYWIYSFALREGGPPRGVRALTRDVDHVAHCITTESSGDRMVYETEHGALTYDHYGYRVVAVIENGAGWMIGVVLQDTNPEIPAQLYAVGVCGESCFFSYS